MLTAIGVILILAGVLAICFGDKQIPVRGGTILKLFDSRPRPGDEEGDFSNWPHKFLIGAALIVAGVMVVLNAAKVM